MRKEKQKLIDNAIKEFSVKNEEVIYVKEEEKFIQSIPKRYTLNNGKKIIREELIKGNNDGSAVIIVPMIDNEFVAIFEPRVFTNLTVGIGFPAGYIEGKEEPIEAAKRELREETGFEAEDFILLDSYHQDEGCSRALNRIYLATNCKKKYNQELDEGEFITTINLNFEELLELEKNGYIMGCNSKIALLRLEKYFKEK